MQDFRNFNDQNLNTIRLNSQGISRLPRNTATTSNALVNGAETPKVGFIKARLNKDNFWNLIFWLGICSNMLLVDFFAYFVPILSLIFFITSLTLTPYLLARKNMVIFNDDKKFVNKNGETLETRYPIALALIIILSIPFSVLSFFEIHKNFPTLKDSMTVYTAIVLILPVLYFIYKNCPISILFNKNAWCKEVTGIDKNSLKNNHSVSDDSSTSFDPYYRHRGNNIHKRIF